MLPNLDHPELFGQHTNADVICQIEESKALFDTLLLIKSKRLQVEKNKENRVSWEYDVSNLKQPQMINKLEISKYFSFYENRFKNID